MNIAIIIKTAIGIISIMYGSLLLHDVAHELHPDGFPPYVLETPAEIKEIKITQTNINKN
jgi:hypothetical protein